MNKELSNRAWKILPKEFREEVKKVARIYSGRTSALFGAERYLANKFLDEFIGLFGHHNLTSDAEGEEMLIISRKEVQEQYQMYRNMGMIKRLDALMRLFGSKCLPDELNEDNFAKSEPKPTEPKEDKAEAIAYKAIKPVEEHFDNILKDGFSKERRLNIAAMAMQGLLNATSVERFTLRISPEAIAEAAFEYADALINMNKKGVTP